MDQCLTMAFAQLTYRESLRDIEVNLRAQAKRLYHMGLRSKTVSRNTMSNANATRPWQIYADFAQHRIAIARPFYANVFFVTRAKSNTKLKRRYSNPVDRANSNTVCDQTGVLTIFYSSQHYPATLRRVGQARQLPAQHLDGHFQRRQQIQIVDKGKARFIQENHRVTTDQ
jgi:hypothetical protein